MRLQESSRASELEAALNRQAQTGWLYVDKWGWGEADDPKAALVVFRKDVPDPIQWISDAE